MADILLKSLEIRNFRAFRHLRVNTLGRVNLIVGKNNIGKTCLLEALRLYARRGSPDVIFDLLESRDESKLPTLAEVVESESKALNLLRCLFYGRKEVGREGDTIHIGPVESSQDVLSISFVWQRQQSEEGGVIRLIPLKPEEYDTVDTPILGIVTQLGSQFTITRRVTRYLDRRRMPLAPFPSEINEIPSIYVPANGPTNEQIAFWRDRSVVEGKRKHVLQALSIIQNDVEDVDLVSNPELKRERTPVVKLKNATSFIPLRSLGEGMNRLFIIALGLVNAQNGMLLIDEVESGLHYSAQADLWRLVLQLARELNIQVFATTHSKDCILAFNKATKELAEEDGVLIRLGRKGEDVVTTLFDEEELEIANEQSIEVR
jgi:ABC-type cobalamin/Fe3+-siderophores transport system ATPase subunit